MLKFEKMVAAINAHLTTTSHVGNPDDALPAPAREKLQSLRDDAQDRRASMLPISDSIADLRQRLAMVEQTIRRHEKQFHPDREALAAEEKRRDDMLRDLARLQARLDERSKHWREAASVVSRVEDFLKSAGPLVLAPPVELPPSHQGEPRLDALSAIRDKIARRRDDRQAVLDAQRPAADVMAEARAAVEALAERGKPSIMGALEGGQPFKFQPGAMEPLARGEGYAQATIDAAALLGWAFKNELDARIETLIRENADDASALTDAERKSRLTEIDAEILGIERAEEAVIEALHAEGIMSPRRPDADPRAILGVQGRPPRG